MREILRGRRRSTHNDDITGISTKWYGFGCDESLVRKYPLVYIAVSVIMILSFCYKVKNALWMQNGLSGEMLINYAGGYVRRGLLGEGFFQIAKTTGVDARWLVIPLCAFVLILVTATLGYFLFKRKYSWWILASPLMCGLVYFVIRRDFILYTLLICSLLLIRDEVTNVRYTAVVILSILALQIHEAYIFWGVPVIFVALLHSRHDSYRAWILLGLTVITFSVLCCFKGNDAVSTAIIDSWNRLPGNARLKDNDLFINALSWDLKGTFIRHLRSNFYGFNKGWIYLLIRPLLGIVIYWFLANVLFVLHGNKEVTETSPTILLAGILAMEFVCMLPMFTVLSCDFGRSVQHVSVASYSMFLILGERYVMECYSGKYRHGILKINLFLDKILKPRTSVIIIMLLVLAEFPVGHYIPDLMAESPAGSLIHAIMVKFFPGNTLL